MATSTTRTTTLSPTKQIYTTPSPWESALGYHRAIRRGPFIFVSGTTALRPVTAPTQSIADQSSTRNTSHPTTTTTTTTTINSTPTSSSIASPTNTSLSPPPPVVIHGDKPRYELQAPSDAYLQTHAAFAESLLAVATLGGTKADVVRVRMYVACQEDVEGVGRGFSEVFGVGRSKQKGERGKGEGGEGERDGGEGVAVAATMVVLGKDGRGGFVDPRMLVEVEVDAVVL